MTPLIALVIGLLIGWLAEWVIDWIYWRRRLAALQAERDQARAELSAARLAQKDKERQLTTLKGEFATLQQKTTGLEADKVTLSQQLSALAGEKSSLAAQLEACQAALSSAKSASVVIPPAIPTVTPMSAVAVMEKPAGRIVEPPSIKPDDLIIIKGIGPVINRKLNQAGIYTFKQLAAITPARLREIVGEVIQRLADEETILAQARDLATRQ
jgi:predicted flap endonuclease-1-like 5' DNA nuclease